MRIFLLDRSYDGGRTYDLKAKEVRYLVNVLRLKPGDRITARDRTNRYYDATIMEGGSLILSPVERPQSSLSDGLSGYRGPMPSIHMYQCICKGRKNEDIARMACEAGVEKLVFISSAYTQEKELKLHSIERIEAIMREAVQQSGSESGTEMGMMTFAQALDEAPGRILLLHQSVLSGTKSLFEALDGLDADSTLSLFVGSEGGFSEEECHLAESRQATACLMPTNILRAETAGIFALGAIENILCSRTGQERADITIL